MPANGTPQPAEFIAAQIQRSPPDLINSREVEERILAAVHNCGYDEPSTFAIKLALEEAMINAIKHGNKLDPNKSVHVLAKITPKTRERSRSRMKGPDSSRTSVP